MNALANLLSVGTLAVGLSAASCRPPEPTPPPSMASADAPAAPVLGAGAPALLQTIAAFRRPESVAFSLDGRELYVGNCASGKFGAQRDTFGFLRGAGAVSRLEVLPDGHAEMVDARLVQGLHSPLGLAVLPRATARYPRGTLLVNVGNALQVDAAGASITQRNELGTGIVFVDPASGQQLGFLSLGVGSPMAERIGHGFLLPNSLAFDGAGNLYVTDTAKGGERLVPPAPAHPGLLRVSHDAIDDPTAGSVSFLAIAGQPNGVGYFDQDDAIYVVTMGGDTPEGQAIYRLPSADFPTATLPEPLVSGVGTMDGIAFTPAGTILTTRFSGDVLVVRRGAARPWSLGEKLRLAGPADHRLLALSDGSSLLAIPEQAPEEPGDWAQRVRLIRLPPGF